MQALSELGTANIQPLIKKSYGFRSYCVKEGCAAFEWVLLKSEGGKREKNRV